MREKFLCGCASATGKKQKKSKKRSKEYSLKSKKLTDQYSCTHNCELFRTIANCCTRFAIFRLSLVQRSRIRTPSARSPDAVSGVLGTVSLFCVLLSSCFRLRSKRSDFFMRLLLVREIPSSLLLLSVLSSENVM